MKRFWICRAVYFILLLLIALPVSAYYHNHSSGGMFIIGILLLLILIPLVKILFYAFLVLVTNKWTWIIGGGLLFLVVLVNIDNEQKKNWHPQTNYPSSSQVQYNSIEMPYDNNQSSKTVSPVKKERTEEYKEKCFVCGGLGSIRCTFCNGTGVIEDRCPSCKGSGGNYQIQCRFCFGRGTVGTFGSTCFECGGSGYSRAYCGNCNGSGKIVSVCTVCDFYKHMVSCKNCSGTGYVTKTRVVEYYE